jgi:putative glutamine amidotransferase
VTRPLILIPGRWSDQIRNPGNQGVYVPRKMLDAVARAGGEPVMAWPDNAERADQLAGLADGVILPGGGDLDLRPFGIPQVHPRERHGPPEQDAADVSICRAALAIGAPILAICRGMQVLNIVLGGSIHQHFDETTVAHSDAQHPVDVVPGTRLEQLLGSSRPTGHSNHHQACDRLADGLRLAAVADDEIIEGFESDDGGIIGLQWHPEIDAAGDPVQQRPFNWLVERTLAPVS